MQRKSRSKQLKTMDYDLAPIINGSLSLEGENDFYSKIKAEVLKVIIRDHDWLCPWEFFKR